MLHKALQEEIHIAYLNIEHTTLDGQIKKQRSVEKKTTNTVQTKHLDRDFNKHVPVKECIVASIILEGRILSKAY